MVSSNGLRSELWCLHKMFAFSAPDVGAPPLIRFTPSTMGGHPQPALKIALLKTCSPDIESHPPNELAQHLVELFPLVDSGETGMGPFVMPSFAVAGCASELVRRDGNSACTVAATYGAPRWVRRCRVNRPVSTCRSVRLSQQAAQLTAPSLGFWSQGHLLGRPAVTPDDGRHSPGAEMVRLPLVRRPVSKMYSTGGGSASVDRTAVRHAGLPQAITIADF